MTAHKPAFLCYPADFISSVDCQCMTMEEFGAYCWLLFQAWNSSPQGYLPDDDQVLARLLRVPGRRFAAIKEAVISKKFQKKGGFIFNERMVAEYSRLQEKSETSRENVMRRWDKDRAVSPANAVGNTEPIHSSSSYSFSSNSKKETRAAATLAIEALNAKAGTKFKATSAATLLKVGARMAEGFKVADLLLVVEKKVAEWAGTEMEKYLRPETLFGPKFEGYLNQPAGVARKESNGDKFARLTAENAELALSSQG